MNERNLAWESIKIIYDGLKNGCSHFSRQEDLRSGEIIDVCTCGRTNCAFYEGSHIFPEGSKPYGNVPGFRVGIVKNVKVGGCRFQTDAIHLGPILLFNRKWL